MRGRLRTVIVVISVLLIVAAVLWPRGVSQATMMITNDGATVSASRWRLIAPRWNPCRFIGWSTRTGMPSDIDWNDGETDLEIKIRGAQSWTTTATFAPGYPPQAMGMVIDDESVDAVLQELVELGSVAAARATPAAGASGPP